MAFGERVNATNSFVPVMCIAYAVWTIFVQTITATHASFDTLLRWLPLAVLTAIVATIAWFRLRQPGNGRQVHADGRMSIGSHVVAGDVAAGYVWLVVLAAAIWVGLLSAGVPYTIFWWGCVVALGAAWIFDRDSIAKGGGATPETVSLAQWLAVVGVVVAAVCVTLIASRPDPDDAFYMSVPATLLRFPTHAVLGGDTMYRTDGLSLLSPIYRLDTYEVLVGTVSRLTGIPHMRVAYEVLPPLFAASAVLVWKQALRLLVPGRWLPTLVALFLVVLALGEAHTAYGNFAFARLFQGKAIFATVMVPAIVCQALAFSRRASTRNWLALFAAQVAAVGFTSSALFAAPAAAGMALASQWVPDLAGTRRLLIGVSASAYVFAAAGTMLLVTHGGHGFVSDAPLLSMLPLIQRTWGPWSTALLLFALLSAWSFAKDGTGKQYLLIGGLLFLLGVLNPYTSRFMADHVTGLSTYWRLTWALPLPFFLAVVCVGVVKGAMDVKPRLLAAAACIVLIIAAVAFGWRCGTLRSANLVSLGMPGLKVYSTEYPVARQVVAQVPENGVVLAPELVATWLPTFVRHPRLLGVRKVYLAQTFSPQEAERRLALMQYVAGSRQTAESKAEFEEAVARDGITCVVVLHAATWREDIEAVLTQRGWTRIGIGAYDTWVTNRNAMR